MYLYVPDWALPFLNVAQAIVIAFFFETLYYSRCEINMSRLCILMFVYFIVSSFVDAFMNYAWPLQPVMVISLNQK